MLGREEWLRRVDYHPAGPATTPIYELNRALVRIVGLVWDQVLPPSRETALAFTDLESALMRANQAVATNLDPQVGELPEVDVSTELDELIERLEGPELTRSGPVAPSAGSDRPAELPPGVHDLIECGGRCPAHSRRPLGAPPHGRGEQ